MFKYDWLLSYLDTDTRKISHIVNDKKAMEEMYNKYRAQIWVGYNSRNYDQWILKAILCDFNPWVMNDWIINKERKGFEFSRLLAKFPVLNYDASVGFRSLKELEAFMGHDIRETSVPFDIDRKLTTKEIDATFGYCDTDVMELFHVFVETKDEFESHMGLIKEFKLPITNVSKTKAQISAIILDAVRKDRYDEFDIVFPNTAQLGKYAWLMDWYQEWAQTKTYDSMELKTNVAGVPHTFGIGGLHGSVDNYVGEGTFIMADVGSYYPALMIEYDFLSRNVKNKAFFKVIRDERIEMKKVKNPKEKPRKIVLNSTYGASKDQYNALYDPLQANNVCIAGQLLLVDLIDKLEGKCQLIQSNTDGILVKLYRDADKDMIISICEEWGKRVRMTMEYDVYKKVIQKDVNNYIIVPEGDLYDKKGYPRWKAKGAFVKKLSPLDNNLPIVNKAVVDYFIKGIPVERTIMSAKNLIDFQFITKISGKYEYGVHGNNIVRGKVHRVFASALSKDETLYKLKKDTGRLEKTGGTPINCFIDNGDVQNKPITSRLDRQWYINLATERIQSFLG